MVKGGTLKTSNGDHYRDAIMCNVPFLSGELAYFMKCHSHSLPWHSTLSHIGYVIYFSYLCQP